MNIILHYNSEERLIFLLVAVSSHHVAIRFCCFQSCIWIVPGTVIGGESRKSEKARIRKGINILIATPGRLADHCDKTSSLKLDNLQYIIIDEADRYEVLRI